MTILLPALAVAFGASCVWLTVRIVNRRERWAKWTAIGLAVAMIYPLSFGPACWWLAKQKPLPPGWPKHAVFGTLSSMAEDYNPYAPRTYWPIGWVARHGPRWTRRIVQWYGTRTGEAVNVPTDWNGDGFVSLWPHE